MNAITVHPTDDDQEKVIKMFLDAQQAKYEHEPEINETDRILANPGMVDKLEKGRRDIEQGKGVKIAPKDIWK
jgi:hypothetical protein